MEKLREKVQYRIRRMGLYLATLLKWVAVGVLIGAVGGVIGSLFHMGVDHAAELRADHPWVLCQAEALQPHSSIARSKSNATIRFIIIPPEQRRAEAPVILSFKIPQK